MPLRWALVEINPGRTRRIKRGKRRGGTITVKIDPKTKRVLKAAARGAKIPDYWIGVEWSRLPGLDRAMAAAARAHRQCHQLAKRCRTPSGKRCRKTFGRRAEFVRALEDATDGKLEDFFEALDPGSPALRDFSDFAGRKGRRAFRSWRQAAAWVAPRSRRWEDVDPMRLQEFAERMREALTSSAGGLSTLDLMGGGGPSGGRDQGFSQFGGIPLPHETERQLEKRRRAQECDDVLDLTTRDLIAELARELEAAPF